MQVIYLGHSYPFYNICKVASLYDDVMAWTHFPVTSPKANNVKLWGFLSWLPDKAVEQTVIAGHFWCYVTDVTALYWKMN